MCIFIIIEKPRKLKNCYKKLDYWHIFYNLLLKPDIMKHLNDDHVLSERYSSTEGARYIFPVPIACIDEWWWLEEWPMCWWCRCEACMLWVLPPWWWCWCWVWYGELDESDDSRGSKSERLVWPDEEDVARAMWCAPTPDHVQDAAGMVDVQQSFVRITFLTLGEQVKATKMKSPCKVLNTMKIIHNSGMSMYPAIIPRTQLMPIRRARRR